MHLYQSEVQESMPHGCLLKCRATPVAAPEAGTPTE
jgi:hypothetical protein